MFSPIKALCCGLLGALIATSALATVATIPPLLSLNSQIAPTRFQVDLAPSDIAWLRQRGHLVVGMWGDDYAPIQFRAGNGAVVGIAADYLILLGNALQIPVRVRWFADRQAAYAALADHQIDLLSTQSSDTERLSPQVSSEPYLQIPLAIVRRAGPVSTDEETPAGRASVVEEAPAALAFAKQAPDTTVPPQHSLFKALEAVALERADYFVGDAISASYYVEQNLFLNLRVSRLERAETTFSFLTANDESQLDQIIAEGLDAIPSWMRANILRRWASGIALDTEENKLALTDHEREWIARHPVVRVGVDTADAPYTFIDSAGEFAGMYADLLKVISRRTGLRFEVVPHETISALESDLRDGRADLATTLLDTPERRLFMAFSVDVAPMAWAIVASSDDPGIDSLESLRGKRLAIVQGHGLAPQLRARYPGIQLVFTRTAADGMDMVVRGKADATLQSMAAASYAIERHFDDKPLHVAATAFEQPYQARFGVTATAPELLGIINKALLSMSPSERAVISAKWLAHINYPTSTWERLRRTLFPYLPWALGLAALIVAWNSLLQYQIRRRKQLERELRQAKDEAERASTEKSNFLAVMSHEIRTPMSAVVGLLEMANRNSRAGITDHEALALAETSAKSLLDIVGGILDVRKIEAGELALSPRAVHLPELVSNTVYLFEQAAQGKGIRLICTVAADIAEWVWIDPVRAKQIFHNLLSNAVKFTTHGEITLQAWVEPMPDEAGQWVRFDVRDTGTGIAATDLPTIFEPFKQASSPQAHMGSGLGLNIVKRLAELMGGHATIASQQGAGTTVSVVLPCPVAAENQLQLAQTWFATAPLRILVVDDHPVNLKVMGSQLSWLGYAPICVGNAIGALQHYGEGVDLILTDCQMPGMSGLELTRRIRAQEACEGRPRIPVIGYTANALPEEHQKCRAAGMDDVLVKPVELVRISQVLADWFPDQVTIRTDAAPIAPPDLSSLQQDLAASLRADCAELATAVATVARSDIAAIAHRIRGAVACVVKDADVDQACVVLEMLSQRAEHAALEKQQVRLMQALQPYLMD
ncbi:ATP-binding protein [Andreprevotia chitinilytica]|uniref:ATP-binding protein n=1 Tax=Andreprevotia chitinilytica TaxID=396808 RepID=UPI000553FE35|nr:transporter substrate-binding domain-containing protein [Andreprevotia chitinilytica]